MVRTLQKAGGANGKHKTDLDKRRAEKEYAKNLLKKAKHPKATLVSGDKSLEKTKKKQPTALAGKTLPGIGRKSSAAVGKTKESSAPRASPRPRHGLRQLKECIRMQQSTRSAIRESPFRRYVSSRIEQVLKDDLTKVPYHHANDKNGFVMYKSVDAMNALRALLTKKSVDLIRRAASYAVACDRRTVSDKDILRAALEDCDLKTAIQCDEEMMEVLDDTNVDGARTRRIQQDVPFTGVKMHIYHALKGDENNDQDAE